MQDKFINFKGLIFTMNKKIIASLMLFLIIFFSFAHAVTIEDAPNSIKENDLATIRQEINSRFVAIDSKLDTFATSSEIESLLVAHLKKSQELNNAFMNSLLLNACFLVLATLGLGYGIYFYYKAKGRL